MSASVVEGRRYRFPPLVRTGLFGTMPAGQVAVFVVGVLVAFAVTLAGFMLAAPVVLIAAGVVGFKRRGSWALHEWIPMRVGWWRRSRRGRSRWLRPIPLVGTASSGRPNPLPPVMAGLELIEVDAAWVRTVTSRIPGIGVIRDTTASTVSAVMRVVGDGKFALADPADQDLRLDGWGGALAAFCREGTPVIRVCWQEWSTTAPLDRPASLVQMSGGGSVIKAQRAYTALIEQVAPRAVLHDVLVTVTVDIGKVPARRGRQATDVAVDVLVEELRLFTHRLEGAGLQVGAPLSPVEVVTAVRSRSLPVSVPTLRTLGGAVGVDAAAFAPMAVVEAFDRVQVDRAWHRSWWVQGWPRLDVPAGWMDPLITHSAAGARVLAVVFEPVAPSAAVRAIDEAAVALESAAAVKAKRGFRIRAADRRARDEVDRREYELVAGYGDLTYAGFITVTTSSSDELDDAAADIEQTAAHAGLALRPLEGRHAAGWVTSLPLGRSMSTRTSR